MVKHVTRCGILDVSGDGPNDLYTSEQCEKIVAGYEPHQRASRARGVPFMGRGLIYPYPRSTYECDPFAVPPHYFQVIGLDFGFVDPTAAVKLACDRDNDIVYVTAIYKQSRGEVPIHGAAIKAMGGNWIPCAWPHDGAAEKGGGLPLRHQYAAEGLNMMASHASYSGESNMLVEPGLARIGNRIATGRWKVFATCREWWAEVDLYHRDDEGRVANKQDDHVMDAARVGEMMLRYGASEANMMTSRMTEAPYDPLKYATVDPYAGLQAQAGAPHQTGIPTREGGNPTRGVRYEQDPPIDPFS